MLNLIAGALVVAVTTYFGRKTMAALDDLTREVAEARTAVDSAVALIEGLRAQLQDAIDSGDMEQVQTLANDLGASTDRLTAALQENVPAPTPAPAPSEPGEGSPGGPTDPTLPGTPGVPVVEPGMTANTTAGNLRRT